MGGFNLQPHQIFGRQLARQRLMQHGEEQPIGTGDFTPQQQLARIEQTDEVGEHPRQAPRRLMENVLTEAVARQRQFAQLANGDTLGQIVLLHPLAQIPVLRLQRLIGH